ncbi:MAG TPA: hypothetical protein VF779_01645 [Pyrinomonadaceae bacterium]
MIQDNPAELVATQNADFQELHQQAVINNINKEFRQEPVRIARMDSGICNEVYLVDLGNRE